MSEDNGLSAGPHSSGLVSSFRLGVLSALLVASSTAALARPEGGVSTVDRRNVGPLLPAMTDVDPSLGFDERVRCQRRIEEVYWRHRIWPAENPGPKPSLDQVLPGEQLRRRVASYLLKSAALETFWSRPLSGEQLQLEMNRIARESRRPEMLREIHAALDDDPHLIAECLARPALAERLTRTRYARDARFHGDMRRRAEAALAAQPATADRMRDLGGMYSETDWRLASDEPEAVEPGPEHPAHTVVELTAEEWRERVEGLAALFGIERSSDRAVPLSALLERIPVGRPSRLIEENDRFVVTSVLSSDSHYVTTATVTWSKRSFSAWWADEGRRSVESTHRTDRVLPPSGGYELRSPLDGGCTADTWEATPEPSAPVARSSHTAVWTGAEMVVWGGSGDGYLNTGGRYDPATHSWSATSTDAGVPTGRYRPTAVWTGTEMIVWGGHNGDENLNTGGRYDPMSDAWAPTSTGVGVPAFRYRHTAVWTGTEMIVWGGFQYFDLLPKTLNTGGRYDPATDSWTPTSAGFGVPSRRYHHTAVWTGTEMIVWGGWDRWEGTDERTGGRYDPATDSWTATSTGTGVPPWRHDHTAVWTGTEMIVWGGDHSIDPLNSGGRYDPATDRWTAMWMVPGVPSPRHTHQAVWTGTEMIVWGGDGNTGGRYDPATESWQATSTGAGVPLARRFHTVVWTGTEMIVWGGAYGSTSPFPRLNSGGSYCACEGSTVSTWYPDTDGDGYGVDSTAIPACSQPSGYIAVGGDCDDRFASCTTDCTDADSDGMPACAPDCDETNPNCTTDCTDTDADGYCVTHECDDAVRETYPGAPETNDGLDNQCPGYDGYGVVDEISGVSGFYNSENFDEFSWTAQSGAASYEVARSSDRRFATDCILTETSDTYWIDNEPVPAGDCHYYLVRSSQPIVGSWGEGWSGTHLWERTEVCP